MVFASGDIKSNDFNDINDNETMEAFITEQLNEIHKKQEIDGQVIEQKTNLLKSELISLKDEVSNRN